jgi:hypothetical protein
VPGSISSFGSQPIAPQSRTQDDQAAVAGTSASDPAALQIFDLEYFRSFDSWTSTYKQHNIALKWFRDSKERIGEDCVIFCNTHAEAVAEIVHPKGMSYHFNEEIKNPWTWQEMVAQMDDASMRLVVEGPGATQPGVAGPQNRSRGLVSCSIQQTDKYDHKRHNAFPGAQQMFKVWYFILVRSDGSSVTLHPNYSDATSFV